MNAKQCWEQTHKHKKKQTKPFSSVLALILLEARFYHGTTVLSQTYEFVSHNKGTDIVK